MLIDGNAALLSIIGDVSLAYRRSSILTKLICVLTIIFRAWGSVVDKALHYKSEGPGIDSEQ